MRPILVALLSAALLSAAESHPGESCATVEYRQVDFLLGNWLVRDASGTAVGTATFAKRYGGCVLLETWLGVGSAGESLGVIGYQPERRRWQRDFLDSSGVVLTLEGQTNGTAMVLTGRDYPADGVRMHRLAWTPRSDGAIEERWQTSADGGRSWQIRFSGVFQRIAE